MKLYVIAFGGMNESEIGKVVVTHGGKLSAVSKNYISYLATDESDTEIIVELANMGLLS